MFYHMFFMPGGDPPKEETMDPGTIVELVLKEPADKWTAQPGARATIVDGRKRFPELYDQLEEYLRNFGQAERDLQDFVWVVWDRGDRRWNGQKDGAYAGCRFKVVGQAPEPKNNDGLSSCHWCGGPTERKQGFMSFYDICPKCGK